MSQIAVTWHLIPDGVTSIIKLSIEGEIVVSSDITTPELEGYIAHVVARISTEDESSIRQKLEAERWLGNWKRPDEPDGLAPHGEVEESAPWRAQLQKEDSSLSSLRPLPLLVSVAIGALIWLVAILGGLSIFHFLQQIWGGN